jgi:hypothetical protein
MGQESLWVQGRDSHAVGAKRGDEMLLRSSRRPRRSIVVVTLCLLLGGLVAVTQLVGRHAANASTTSWACQLVTPALSSTSCADPSHCVSVGASPDYQTPVSMASSDRGLYWQTGSFPSGSSGPLNGVSCIDALHCWAAGTSSTGDPTVYVTSDGALAWADQIKAVRFPAPPRAAPSMPSLVWRSRATMTVGRRGS